MTVDEMVTSVFDADRYRYRNLDLGEAIEAVMQKHPDADWGSQKELHKAAILWRVEFDRREARVTTIPQKAKKSKSKKSSQSGFLKS